MVQVGAEGGNVGEGLDCLSQVGRGLEEWLGSEEVRQVLKEAVSVVKKAQLKAT